MPQQLSDKQLPYRLVIFDVDGTLVDSFQMMVDVVNEFAPKYKFKVLDQASVAYLRELPPLQIRKALNLSALKAFLLVLDCKTKVKKEKKAPSIFAGISETLTALKQEGIQLAIVTSNSKENCLLYLGQELFDIFDWIECDASIYGKARKIKKIVQRSKFSQQEILYIGDQIVDIQSAHKNGIQSAAVTWGYNTESSLIQHQPHHLVQNIQQLQYILFNLA